MLGYPVALELIRAGHTVRVIARDVAKAKALFLQSEVVPGDVQNATSLTDALQGMGTVYLAVHYTNRKTKRFFVMMRKKAS